MEKFIQIKKGTGVEKSPNIDLLLFYFNQKQWNLLLQESQKILKDFPHDYFVYQSQGIAYFYLNQFEKSVHSFQQAYSLNKNSPDLIKNYINALLKLRKEKDAIFYLEKLIPFLNHSDEKKHCFIQIAQLACKNKMPFLTMLNYANAVALDPKNALLLNDFAVSLINIGENIQAEKVFEESLKFAQNEEEKNKIKLFRVIESSYFNDITPKKIKKIALDYLKTQKYEPLFEHKKEKNLKKLKIGLISGDFNSHVVSLFIEEWLKESQNLKLNLEFYAYSARNFEDSTTQKLKPLFKKFTPIFHVNDVQAAQMIFNDGIHILGDLSGHTLFSRLGIFKYRPAFASFSAIGWLGTTATLGVDYIFADAVSVPSAEIAEEFTEKVILLPKVFQVFSKEVYLPPVSSLPFEKNRFFTFGAFQNPNKVNRQAIDLWCQALKKTPTAHFLWAHAELAEESFRAHILAIFMEKQIDPARLQFIANQNSKEYLLLHNKVDLILDTLPANSATTLVEALLMGVPTLTILGKTRAGRLAGSFLNAVGLNDFICENKQVFFKRLKEWTSPPPPRKPHPLALLRKNLRQRVLSSPLTDSAFYACNMEKAFFQMYDNFLNDKNPR